MYILQIFSKLVVSKLLIRNHSMHNLYAIFVKILDICKKFSNGLVDGRGNTRRPGTSLISQLLIQSIGKRSFLRTHFIGKRSF